MSDRVLRYDKGQRERLAELDMRKEISEDQPADSETAPRQNKSLKSKKVEAAMKPRVKRAARR